MRVVHLEQHREFLLIRLTLEKMTDGNLTLEIIWIGGLRSRQRMVSRKGMEKLNLLPTPHP